MSICSTDGERRCSVLPLCGSDVKLFLEVLEVLIGGGRF